MPDLFSVPIFFIIFREGLEVVIICSVLLAFLKQSLDGPKADVSVYHKLRKQVYYGAAAGLLLCFIVGGAMIGVFYKTGLDAWAQTEYYWEASFAIVASLIISIIGAGMLRLAKMQEKWRVKIALALEKPVMQSGSRSGVFKRFCEKYAMFLLPFITVLREGLEAIVFVAGVSFQTSATAIPLPVVVGLIAGLFAGFLIYKTGASSKLQLFLVVSTCLLYLVAAGLFSKAIWWIQAQKWNDVIGGDAAETGSGPGSYDIDQSVWHVNFGNPELNGGGGWGIFNAILGWQNSATYGSVISYNLYWLCVICAFLAMRFHEVKGYWPLFGRSGEKLRGVGKAAYESDASSDRFSGTAEAGVMDKKGVAVSARPVAVKTISDES